ncbi:MAG TPA: hypothetical protein VFE51_03870 [Verrucomicrobiae bacterium]|nr:hypothetical protein [Verrucomicrobiae bacterium]
MKRSKWPDFLLTVAVRFVCGFVLGCLACFVLFWRGILRSFSHNNSMAPLVIMIVCGVVGSLIAVFTIPHWQTPWYKGIRNR